MDTDIATTKSLCSWTGKGFDKEIEHVIAFIDGNRPFVISILPSALQTAERCDRGQMAG